MLLVLVAVLVSVVYFKPGKKTAADAAPLVADARGFQTIRIQLAGTPEVDLKRQGEAWMESAPIFWPADAAQMQGLLDSLDAPVENRFPAQGADLKTYGLDKPLLKLWLDDSEYDFGAMQPISKQRYVQKGGEVLLIDDYVFYRAANDAYGWLDKRLLPEGAGITALQLPHATFTSDAKGVWQLAPADKDITQKDLERFISGWQQAHAVSLAPIGKGRPEGEVALVLAGVKDPLRFQMLDDPDYLVLARPDLGFEYRLEISDAETLFTPTHDDH